MSNELPKPIMLEQLRRTVEITLLFLKNGNCVQDSKTALCC